MEHIYIHIYDLLLQFVQHVRIIATLAHPYNVQLNPYQCPCIHIVLINIDQYN